MTWLVRCTYICMPHIALSGHAHGSIVVSLAVGSAAQQIVSAFTPCQRCTQVPGVPLSSIADASACGAILNDMAYDCPLQGASDGHSD